MLKIHFLNVGHGDCTVIEHPSGNLTMIDINDSREYDPDTARALTDERRSRTFGLMGPNPFEAAMLEQDVRSTSFDETTDPVEYFRANFPGREIFRFVLTHPDLDHMRGLSRLVQSIDIANFWDTNNTKPTPDFRDDGDERDWTTYQAIRRGTLLPGSYRTYVRGAQLFAFGADAYGNQGGDRIEILSPSNELVNECNAREDWNNLSIVLRVSHGRRSILLPGDAEERAWQGMDLAYGARLKSCFLKASHHGRDSGYHLPSLQKIKPRAAFVSVGRKPNTDASHKYHGQCPDGVLSTRYYGNLVLTIHDDGQAVYDAQRNS